ncbi:MAG: HAMP domain-containing sensor histidine kinase [Caldimonas sp.]
MAKRFTLTERVVWAVTATVALLVGLQSLLAYAALHVQEDELSDTMLQREVQQIVAHTMQPGLTPTGTLIDSTHVSAWLAREGSGASGMPPALSRLAPGLYRFERDGTALHVAVRDTEDGRLTVTLDATAAENRVQRFGLTLLALWLVCVGATVWIARAVAAVAVGPIVQATRTIARSAPGQAAATEARRDEAGMLMDTFNRFRDRADDMVAREREFAANLDHEIRTPLTAIRTDAELLGLEARLPVEQQARLDRITAAVDEIGATTTSALSYSAGRSVGAETFGLREFLHSAADALADRAEGRALRVVIQVGAEHTLHADRQALLTIVRNLLRNALEHAAPATLVIRGDASALAFSDDGPGIDAAPLAHLFDRHPRGAGSGPQRGLGLAIARRLCALQGWRLEVRSPAAANARGTEFTLTFDAGKEGASAA